MVWLWKELGSKLPVVRVMRGVAVGGNDGVEMQAGAFALRGTGLCPRVSEGREGGTES